MVGYHDGLLVLIALAMLLGAVSSIHPMVAPAQGLAGGSLASTVVMYEALFRNPPTEPTRTATAAPAVVGVGWLLTVVFAV